jgi:deoxyadenosine/deoxycytidine kinase
MGALITLIGNSGVGKTTLTHLLQARGQFYVGFEQHEERPFQKLFSKYLRRYAFSNQVDYLLFRAEQEYLIRQSPIAGILDGGLDQDFHVFTSLFFEKGYLSRDEFRLCERLYFLLRQMLPSPEVIIYLTAPLDVIAERFARRGRSLEIAQIEDLHRMQNTIDRWIRSCDNSQIVRIDAGHDDPTYSAMLEPLFQQIQRFINI